MDKRGRFLWAMGFAILLLIGSFGSVLAQDASLQDDSLNVYIDWPNEGETFYSGPSSLLYNVAVHGRVSCVDCDLDDTEIQLELIQESEVISSQVGDVSGDGAFTFYITVNPKNSDGNFGSIEGGSSPDLISCGGDCHFITELAFPNGVVQIRVTANTADGLKAVDTRKVVIDRSAYANVPVYVHLADHPDQAIAGVEVLGSTRLYLWRERHAANFTGQNGLTILELETLSQADTNYVLSIQPTIVDGALYQGVEPAFLDLAPGAVEGSRISLAVTRTIGQIEGALAPDLPIPDLPANVWLINASSGQSLETDLTEQGTFVLQNLYIDRYLVSLDQQSLIKQGVLVMSKEIDLSQAPHSRVVLPGRSIEGAHMSGHIVGAGGEMLPFGWVSSERGTALQGILPDSGEYLLYGLPDAPVKLTVTAPGYYSQEAEIDLTQHAELMHDFILVPQADTEFLPWGDGSIVLPVETQADHEGYDIQLARGWLWGQGEDSVPLNINISGQQIEITRGRFALEYLPGNAAWFYLFEGLARLRSVDSSDVITIETGQMVNLVNPEGLEAVSYHPVVKAAIHPNARALLSATFEPSSEEVAREQTRGLAIGAAQALALVTYSLSALVILISPLLLVRWWLQRR